jgi:sugar phosphate isomerase/epimerase
MPKLSIGSWAFTFGPFERRPWPISKVLEYAAHTGYDGIELNGFRPHPHPDDYNTVTKCREFTKKVEDLGLGISGYAPDFTSVPPSEINQEEYLRIFGKCLTFCENCGINVIRVDTVSPPNVLSKDDYEERFSRLSSTWYKASNEAEKSGILLVWEFEPGFWLNKPSEVKRLAESVGHDNFRLLFDTSHAYMGSVMGARQTGEKELLGDGVTEYANMLSDHIGHLHLIDSDGTLHGEETSTHTPFGKGRIDFKKVLNSMKPFIKDLPWWCVDFCFCAEVEKAGKDGAAFLRDISKEVLLNG